MYYCVSAWVLYQIYKMAQDGQLPSLRLNCHEVKVKNVSEFAEQMLISKQSLGMASVLPQLDIFASRVPTLERTLLCYHGGF